MDHKRAFAERRARDWVNRTSDYMPHAYDYFYKLIREFPIHDQILDRMTNEQFAMAKALQWQQITQHKDLFEFDRSFKYFLNFAKEYGTLD